MKKLTILFLSIVLLLTGCSKYDPTKEVNVGWADGKITYNGKPTELTMYAGNVAEAMAGNGGQDYFFTYEPGAADASNITANTQGVLVQDMVKFNGKLYYTEYLDSKFTMAQELAENTFQICQVMLSSTKDLTAKYASDYLDSFCLTGINYKVDFGDFYFGSGYEMPKITNSGASISGIAKVSKDSKGASEPYDFIQGNDTYPMMYMTTGKYDYYEYNGFLIQVASGISLSDYITMK